MAYFPSEAWTDKLFCMDGRSIVEPLHQKGYYQTILATALNNKEKNVGIVGFHGQDQNELLFEIAKEHGIVLLTKFSGDFPSDHIIMVPMGVQNGEPQDFWILEIEEETYDGRPLSNDLSDTEWRINKLGDDFIRVVDQLLTLFYERQSRGLKRGYDAINKRVV